MKSIIIISNDTSYNLQHPAPADPAPADPAPLAPLDPAPQSDIEEEDQDHGDVVNTF